MAYFGKKLSYTYEPKDIIRPGDGINTFQNPFEIKKSECVSALNIDNRFYPAISSRQGVTKMYGTGTTALTCKGVGVRAGTTFHVLDGTIWKYWNGSSFTNVTTGLTSASAKFLEFNTGTTRYTIMVNGTEKKYWNGSGASSNITDGPATNLYAIDDYRLYGLLGAVLKCSAAGSVTDWTTVDDADTINITSMIGAGTAIAVYNDMVICWSDATMHILYGDDPTNFTLSDPIPTGCVSDRSIVIHDGTLYFMDYNKIKIFTGGIPQEISQKVKSYLENINYTYKSSICAGKWNKYLYFSFPYGLAQTTNNITLVYDTQLGNWYPMNKGYVNFYNIGVDIYGVTTAGVAEKLNQGNDDDGTAITWEMTFGVWDTIPLRSKKVLSDIWAVVDLPVASTLTLSYSTTVDNSDFTTLYTFTGNANEQNTRIQIPTTILQDINFYRLKFSGTGQCTIFYLEPYLRVKAR